MDEYDIAQRRESFNLWLVIHGERIGYHRIPSSLQGLVHEMLRKAYNAGDNYQRKLNEPVRVGGND